MTDDLDLAEAADYILGERPGLDEDHVWGVLTELGEPPPVANEDMALALLGSTRPEIPGRTARLVMKEWRAYATLATEPDWDDD